MLRKLWLPLFGSLHLVIRHDVDIMLPSDISKLIHWFDLEDSRSLEDLFFHSDTVLVFVGYIWLGILSDRLSNRLVHGTAIFANQRNLNLILFIIWIEHFLKVAFNSEQRDSWSPSVMEHVCVIGGTLCYTLIWVLRYLNFVVWEFVTEHFLHPLDSAGPAN